jgi:hypothetical protein
MKEFDLEYVKEHWEEARAGKLLRTRNGRSVKLLCLDAKRTYPIIGLIQHPNPSGEEVIESWTINGKYKRDNDAGYDLDLVIAIKHEGWMNIYTGKGSDLPYGAAIYPTKEIALNAQTKASATVKIEWEE